MKIAILTLTLTLLVTGKGYSQEKQVELKNFGIGISHALNFMETYQIEYPMDLNKILFPINLNNKFRIEPEISGAYNAEWEEFWVSVGSGFYFQKQSKKLNTLYGLRSSVSISDWGGVIVNVAPAVGLEYFFSPQFSFGAEIQLKAGLIDGGLNLALMAPIAARFYLK